MTEIEKPIDSFKRRAAALNKNIVQKYFDLVEEYSKTLTGQSARH